MNAHNSKKERAVRPPRRNQTITLELPPALLEWIDSQAELNETSRSDMIRRLIEESRLGVPPELGQLRTAYHEAGHAVVARVLGIPVTIATVIADDKSLGHVVFAETPLQMHHRLFPAGGEVKDLTAWKAHIRATMAGREAEIAVLGFHHDDKGDRQDKRHINRLAKWLDYRTRDETLHYLRADTNQIVGIMSRSIRRVAEVLTHTSSLTQDELDEIIKETGETLGPDLLRAFGLKKKRKVTSRES
ncbi:hypothetical protein ABIF27_003188 [Bradyrhizobium elkanii]